MKAGAAKRTAWGDPDLQGTWFVLFDVPLERSASNANKAFLTDAEVAAANKRKKRIQGAMSDQPTRNRTSAEPTTLFSTPSSRPANTRR